VPMEVSMITTQYRQQVYQMPRCEYTLRKENPNGPIVQFAILGQKIFHRWECFEEEGRDTFGMLVHSCYVDNGFGDRVDILDENGCGVDAVLLATPEYEQYSLRLATKSYHVFKYADRPVLQFQCQVTLCLKIDDGCKGITPPKCPETKPRHILPVYASRRAKSKLKKIRRLRDTESDEGGTLDVFTKPMMIVDEQFSQLAQCPAPGAQAEGGSGLGVEHVAKGVGMGSMDLFTQYSLVSLIALVLLNLLLAGATLVFWINRRFRTDGVELK